jgi:hypothetical protein
MDSLFPTLAADYAPKPPPAKKARTSSAAVPTLCKCTFHLCNAVFSTPGRLAEHLRTRHKGQRPPQALLDTHDLVGARPRAGGTDG